MVSVALLLVKSRISETEFAVFVLSGVHLASKGSYYLSHDQCRVVLSIESCKT